MRSPTFVISLLLLGTLACGGAPPREPIPVTHADEPEKRPVPSTSFSVSGLHGTLSQQEVDSTLKPRLPKFLRCAQQRLAELDVLAGSLRLSFHIATNGAVAGVSPIASTLGDRATERCMLDVAATTRFPPPHGGEADFTWPLELPGDPEVREPVPLAADVARSARASAGPAGDVAVGEVLHARCGGGQMVVTAYLDPAGVPLAVGVAAPDLVTPTELDCIASGVQSWTFDSPGSYVGKVTFTLP